jgi:hypothetical protein
MLQVVHQLQSRKAILTSSRLETVSSIPGSNSIPTDCLGISLVFFQKYLQELRLNWQEDVGQNQRVPPYLVTRCPIGKTVSFPRETRLGCVLVLLMP